MLILRKIWSNDSWAILKFNKIQFSSSYFPSNPNSINSFNFQLGIPLAVTRYQYWKGPNVVLDMEPREFEKALNLPQISLLTQTTWQASIGSMTVVMT